jgi:hypothetical protein
MNNLVNKTKLIGGVLIIICCLLPFFSVSFFGRITMSGFSLFKGNFGAVLSILLILAGAAVLIYVDMVKDITFAPKITLSLAAKLAALAGGVIMLITVLSSSYTNIGVGLIF